MKKLISYVITLAIILSLVIIPSATSASAETTFLDDGVFTFDSASDVYVQWGGGSPAPTYTLSGGSINISYAAQWTYDCVLLPVKLKAGESYSVKINYNVPKSSRLWVFRTERSPLIDKTNDVINKVLEYGSTSGDKETVFSFTATDDTKNILGLYFENCSPESFTAKVNSVVVKKTTTGEANLEFNDSLDMACAWKYGTGATAPAITSDNGHSAIVTTLPKWTQTRIAFPVKIEAGKTYKYKVTMRSSTGTALTKVKLFVGDAASSAVGNPDTETLAVLAASVKVSQNYADYLGEFTVDASKITETQNLLSIYVNNSGDDDINEIYYIDAVAISEKKALTPKAQDTIEFDSLSDVTGTQTAGNGASAAPVVRHDVANGKVCVDFNNSQWAHARIGLPVKLERDTDYIFTIKYKAPKTTTYFLFAGETGKPLYPYTGQLSGKTALTTSNDIKELQFEYKASAGKITDLNNLLGLYVESSVTDTYTVEIYSVSYQSQKTSMEDGTVNFNSSLSYTQRGVYNKPSTAIEEINGTNALAITLPLDAQMNIEVPVKLKTGNIYKYTISYYLDAPSQSGLYLYMASAPSGTSWVNNDKYYIAKPVVNGNGIEIGSGFNTGTFAATADKDIETNDTLYFYLKSAVSAQKLYIKSITLEILKGDFNGDCEIGVNDLICMRKALLAGNETGTAYDINKDNAVNVLDLIRIKKNCIISPAGDSFNGYTLVFADDFEGTALDSGWQLNTFDNDNTKVNVSNANYSLSNGKLTLSSVPTQNGYYSGTEMFRKDFTFSHGYFEIRAKLATGGGNQSAFWGKGSSGVDPYYAPEIDVFETFGRADTITSCFHSWWKNDVTVPGLDTTNAANKNGKMNIQHIRGGITNMTGSNQKTVTGADTEFHTYGCEWTSDYIKYYVDRVCYCTVDLTQNTGEYAIYNSDNDQIRLYISHAIMQDPIVAAVNGQTQTPSNFVVDYVRLYQGVDAEYTASK